MTIRAVLVLVLVFGVWPLFLGLGLGLKRNIDRYLVGFATVQALFYIVYIPAICFSWSSSALAHLSFIVISLISIGGVIIRFLLTSSHRELMTFVRPNLNYLKNPFFILAIGLIIYELWVYIVKEPYIYGDDVTYITLITRFVDTNAIYTKDWAGQIEPYSLLHFETRTIRYVFTSYYPFIGSLSLLTNIHPLVMCKTLIPVIYLPTHYLIIWRIGCCLFGTTEDIKKRIEQQSLFFFIYALLIEFGHISYYTMSRRALLWIYNSKSDCFTILLPILFLYMYMFVYSGDEENCYINRNTRIYKSLVIVILAISCISSTLMGLIMSAIVMMTWYFLYALKEKRLFKIIPYFWTLVPHLLTIIAILVFIRSV